jgi:hypothetical protein
MSYEGATSPSVQLIFGKLKHRMRVYDIALGAAAQSKIPDNGTVEGDKTTWAGKAHES